MCIVVVDSGFPWQRNEKIQCFVKCVIHSCKKVLSRSGQLNELKAFKKPFKGMCIMRSAKQYSLQTRLGICQSSLKNQCCILGSDSKTPIEKFFKDREPKTMIMSVRHRSSQKVECINEMLHIKSLGKNIMLSQYVTIFQSF